MSNRYLLLTAAKNEADYISRTIESVLRQTIRPLAWFIVDDGSTDQTAEIVRTFAAQHPFIHLLSSSTQSQRSFGSKDKAINAACASAKKMDFDFLGILDADIAFERDDYYECILGKFAGNPRLGIAGGYIYERANGAWQCRKGNSEDSVAGGMQLFRRACYEQIGGYVPMHYGGEDWLAQIDARMAGWEVLACPEYHVFHYRPTSSAGGHWRGLFRLGLMDASFGSHPVFELFKCCRRVWARPVLLGSALRFGGYVWWNVSGRKPLLAPEKVAFLRREQMAKMRRRVPVLALKPETESKQLSA
jgi:glycosyltransferase involved in cell wall biosynthesis